MGEGDGGEGLSEQRKEEEGGGKEEVRGKCRERERYWSDSGVRELILKESGVGFNCGRGLEKRSGKTYRQEVKGQRCWGERE